MANDRRSLFQDLLLHLSESISDRDFSNMKFKCSPKYISQVRMEKIKDTLDLFRELQYRKVIASDKVDVLKDLIYRCADKKRELIDEIILFERGEWTLAEESEIDETFAKASSSSTNPTSRDFKEEIAETFAKASSSTSPTSRDFKEEIAETFDKAKASSSTCPTQTRYLKEEITLLKNNLELGWKFFIRNLDVPESELELKLKQNPHAHKEAIEHCLNYWLNSKLAVKKTDEEIRGNWIKGLQLMERNDLVSKLKSIKKANKNCQKK